MIKKDLKYIIKRIIIGVGIVLVLSCLNACKVKAANIETINYDNGISSVSFDVDLDEFPYYILSYDWDVNVYYLWQYTYQPTLYRYYNPPGTPIINYSWSLSQKSARYCASRYKVASNTYYLKYDCYNTNGYDVFSFNTMENAMTITNDKYGSYKYLLLANFNFDIATGYDINYFINHNANTYSVASTFVSFNAIPITTNNVITSYTIQPEFSNFDTENYVYQYSFDRNRWLSLTENKQLLRINNNSTIYIRIKNKNTNDIIDSSTFTISNIGTFYDHQTYNINFSGDYRTDNYLNDNMCVFEGSKSDIKEFQIYIDYVPKSSILTYQYQYVPADSQLDNNNWQTLSSNDKGSITYTATENGTLYARILNKEDNVLKISTFKVSSIGKTAIDDIDKQCTKNIFQKFSSEINYGGPVSILFKIPVDLLSSLYNTASTSNTCHPYVISKLMGTNFVLPCFDLEDKFGSTIYSEIDAMLCFILSIMFFKFLLKIYNDFISMKDIN